MDILLLFYIESMTVEKGVEMKLNDNEYIRGDIAFEKIVK